MHLRIFPASLPWAEASQSPFLIFDPSNPLKSRGLIWEEDGSFSVIALWRYAVLHQYSGVRRTPLWAVAEALWTLGSTCYCSEVQHYKEPQHRQMRSSPLWTPIQLECLFVCLFHFSHTLPSQELICGLLQVTVWRWQTCSTPLSLTLLFLPSGWVSFTTAGVPTPTGTSVPQIWLFNEEPMLWMSASSFPFQRKYCLELFLHTTKLMCLVGLHYSRLNKSFMFLRLCPSNHINNAFLLFSAKSWTAQLFKNCNYQQRFGW